MSAKMTREDWLVAVLTAAISTMTILLLGLDYEQRQGEKRLERIERIRRRGQAEAERLGKLESRVESAIHNYWPSEINHAGCSVVTAAVRSVFADERGRG
jgi:hypothetical protein